jgi:putative redox protein
MSNPLADAISAADRKFRGDAARAQATFTSESRLGEGFRSEVSLRGHALTVDEPQGIGGSDAGPTPIELVLAALGTCQEITYRAFATALGIPLAGVAVTVEGDIDFRGFFAIDDSIRPGFERIRVHVTLDSTASEQALQRLVDTVNRHCPVLDMLTTPVPTATTMSRVTR